MFGSTTSPVAALKVRKRSGRVVDYKQQKIVQAVLLCLVNSCKRNMDDATRELATNVATRVEAIIAKSDGPVSVEQIQDIVEQVLMAMDEHEAAREYIIYREHHRLLRETAAVDPAVEQAIRDDRQFFKTDAQLFQHYDKYARFNDQAKRRETFVEAADRQIAFMRYEVEQRHGRVGVVSEQEWGKLRRFILQAKATPSMRLMQTAGPAATRCNVGVYNCSYCGISDLDYFHEGLYISMQGTGHAFSVESELVEQLPQVQFQRKGFKPDKLVIDDSTEGWCHSVRDLTYALYDGYDLNIDYSQLRPAGARLKTKGGTSSGPKPLMELHQSMRRIITARQGRRLRDIDVHDVMCFIGRAGEMGGFRRAACLSMSDLDSMEMRMAKATIGGKGYYTDPDKVHRSMANNSAAYWEKPDALTFLDEWVNLAKSKSGERGIFNRGSLVSHQFPERRRRMYEEFDGPLPAPRIHWGCNPCQPAHATLLTRTGITTMGKIKVGDEIWTGKQWSKVIRKEYTGEKPVFHYLTAAGYFIGTENHRVVSHGVKMEAKVAHDFDVCAGEQNASPVTHADSDVLAGLLVGDGSVSDDNTVFLVAGMKDLPEVTAFRERLTHDPRIGQWSYTVSECPIAADELPRQKHLRSVPARYKFGTRKAVAGFLRGLFSANGHVNKSGGSVRLKATSFRIVTDTQEMLSSLGIRSAWNISDPAERVLWPDGHIANRRQNYDLVINADRHIFNAVIGFIHQYKTDEFNRHEKRCRNTKSTYHRIGEPVACGCQPVWDITVEADEHTYWTGGMLVSNCGEIYLHPNGQFCNLSIGICRPDDTVDSLLEKVEVAAIFGTIQSMMTTFNYLRPRWKENCERERLLGVDLLGALDCPLLRAENPDRERILEALKHRVISTNQAWSTRLGISASTATTCIKPGGNSGFRWGTGQSMSGWMTPHMIRNVEVGNHNPMCAFLKEQGVPHEVCYRDSDTTIFSFPLQAPEGAMIVADLKLDASGNPIGITPRRTAIDQLEDWLAFKKHWTEHNPSVSIYVADNEWLEVGHWVYSHWDDVGGLSFFPLDNGIYVQAPFTPVTQAKFEEFMAKFPAIQWEKLPRYDGGRDNCEGHREKACTGKEGCSI